MRKKYKVVRLEYDNYALVAKDEILFFDELEQPRNRKTNKPPKNGSYIDTKSWDLNKYHSFLTRNEFSRILDAYRCLGY